MDPSLRGRMPQVPFNRKSGRFQITPRTLLLVGVGLAIITIALILLNLSGDKSGPLQQRLNARLETFSKIVAEGDKNIKDPDLRELNGRLRTQLTSDQKTIGDTLTQKKTDKAVTANEADTASFASLEEARLNSHFDDAYRKIVAEKLDTTTLLIRETYTSTRSKSLKEALDNSYQSLKQLETQFEAVTSS